VVVVSDDVEREISQAAFGRRSFLRRLAVGSAFAVPVVSSFSMAGIKAVSAQAQPGGSLGNCNSTVVGPNQTIEGPNGGYGYGQESAQEYGNIPLSCSNQQPGVLGFFEDIFNIFPHSRRPI
jgi:hypothetical protein